MMCPAKPWGATKGARACVGPSAVQVRRWGRVEGGQREARLGSRCRVEAAGSLGRRGSDTDLLAPTGTC